MRAAQGPIQGHSAPCSLGEEQQPPPTAPPPEGSVGSAFCLSQLKEQRHNLLFHEQHLSLSLGGKNASEKEQLASYNNTDGKERVTYSYPKTRAVTGA